MGLIKVKILASFIICMSEVNSMAIKGPPLTRYDPCALGVLHFDRISEKFWQGVVNLGLYSDLASDVAFDVNFDKQVTIYGASQNSTLTVTNDRHNFKFKPKGDVPEHYTFFVKIEDSETDVPVVKTFVLNNVTLCNDYVKESETVESLNVTTDEQYYSHVCGRRSLDHAELTSVRTESNAGDWPWHVAILIEDRVTKETKYECGGSIISRTAIVTAGHCITRRNIRVDTHRIVIVAGISNHTDVNQVGRQMFIAEKVILHPNYNDAEATADLAVIKISNLKFTKYVQPVCLWGPVYDKSNLFGYQATVVGFGRTEENKPSQVLRSAYTMVQNDTTCINYSPKLYLSLLNEFTFCAGFGPTSGINPRNGDSGGGLVVPTMQPDHKLSWFLRGVLSKCGVAKGHTDCDPEFYVVYTDIGPHYGWLYHHSGLQFRNNIMM